MENRKFDLISGQFTIEEAQELIRNLYTDKVNFHEKRKFIQWETNQGDSEKNTLKIAKLKQDLKDLLGKIENLAEYKSTLNINATIEIS